MAKKKKSKGVKQKKVSEKKEKPEEEKVSKKEQIKSENKILKVFIILAVAIFILLLVLYTLNHRETVADFEYAGLNFTIQDHCDEEGQCIRFYNAKLPYVYEGRPAKHNFYFRNDPRDLDKEVLFEGEIDFKNVLYLDTTFERNCTREEVIHSKISIDVLVELFRDVLGLRVESKEKGLWEDEEESMNIWINESDKTQIEQIGPATYRIDIKNCEIQKGIEKFLLETLIQLTKN